MTKQELAIQAEKRFEPTIDNAIRDMKFSKILFCKKDNKFYSSIARQYLQDKEKFLPFIIEGRQTQFMAEYSQVFQEVGIESDESIAWRLLNWEHSGDIMMLLSADTNWSAVDKALHLQGHTGGTISCLASKILYFSPYGLDFIEHVFGVDERFKAEKEINIIKNSFV